MQVRSGICELWSPTGHCSWPPPLPSLHKRHALPYFTRNLPQTFRRRRYRQINNHTDQDNLQNDLDRLTDWDKTWQITFKPSKYEIMHITRYKSPIHNSYTIHDEPLRAVPVATHLSIDISSNLSWNPHINKIVNKANSKLGCIKRNLKSIPQPIKKYAYRSLVRPHLEYCCPVWDLYTIRNINHLEGVQHRVARFVAHNYSWKTSGSTLASALSWPTLEQRRAEARLCTMYKITNNLVDINPNQYLIPGHSQTRSNHPHKYRQISTSHNYYKYSFFLRTIAQWNRLPPNVFSHNSLDAFKGALQDINLTTAPLKHLY